MLLNVHVRTAYKWCYKECEVAISQRLKCSHYCWMHRKQMKCTAFRERTVSFSRSTCPFFIKLPPAWPTSSKKTRGSVEQACYTTLGDNKQNAREQHKKLQNCNFVVGPILPLNCDANLVSISKSKFFLLNISQQLRDHLQSHQFHCETTASLEFRTAAQPTLHTEYEMLYYMYLYFCYTHHTFDLRRVHLKCNV